MSADNNGSLRVLRSDAFVAVEDDFGNTLWTGDSTWAVVDGEPIEVSALPDREILRHYGAKSGLFKITRGNGWVAVEDGFGKTVWTSDSPSASVDGKPIDADSMTDSEVVKHVHEKVQEGRT